MTICTQQLEWFSIANAMLIAVVILLAIVILVLACRRNGANGT